VSTNRFCVRYVPEAEAFLRPHRQGGECDPRGEPPADGRAARRRSRMAPRRGAGRAVRYTVASEVQRVGVPAGVTVWCDLEGVSAAADPDAVIEYCNAWHQEVAAAGFVPGLYVGDSPGLTAQQLYAALKFTHYWGAYNLNRDQEPRTRGLQLKQTVPSAQQRVPGHTFEFQVDGIRTDALGAARRCSGRSPG
jgi:hypothetical protein